MFVMLGLGGLGVIAFLLQRSPGTSTSIATRVVPVEIFRTNLVLADGRLRRASDSNVFTGFMVEKNPDGSFRSRTSVSNGLLNGISQGWFTNGHLQVSENFKDGVSHGVRTKWYADGQKQSEASIVDGEIQGTFRRWHPNGVLAEQAEFVANKPAGTSVAYFPSGCLKARVVMKDGKPAEQTFWKDGEKKE